MNTLNLKYMTCPTPKTIREAISNGIEEYSKRFNNDELEHYNLESLIEKHVKDFLAQRFSKYTVSNDKVIANASMSLFEELDIKKE